MLKKSTFEVQEAATSAEALRPTLGTPDLILVDLYPPAVSERVWCCQRITVEGDSCWKEAVMLGNALIESEKGRLRLWWLPALLLG